MRVHVVDPAAYTPPYDAALCAALADREDIDVTLVTARFPHGEVPPADGYGRQIAFYRGTDRLPRRARTLARLARHAPDMRRYAQQAEREADVVHFQWLPVQALDAHLLPDRPVVVTAHDVLPREPRGLARLQRHGQAEVYRRAAAVVVHSRHGAQRLRDEVELDPERVHVIPHGALTDLLDVRPRQPPELREPQRPVVLFFGLIRPYKGLDVLLAAWAQLEADAELWVVGQPRIEVPPLPPGTTGVLRYVSPAEAAWCLAHADVAVLPYREIDQSGVLFTALAFGLALVVSDVGGLPEVDAALVVPAGRPDALAAALQRVLDDAGLRQGLAERSRAAAAGEYAWPQIAARHAELYAQVAA